MGHRRRQAARLHMRVGKDPVDGVDRAAGHMALFQRGEHVGVAEHAERGEQDERRADEEEGFADHRPCLSMNRATMPVPTKPTSETTTSTGRKAPLTESTAWTTPVARPRGTSALEHTLRSTSVGTQRGRGEVAGEER